MGIFMKIARSRQRLSRMFGLTGAAEQLAFCDEAEVMAAEARCMSCEEPEACERFLASGAKHGAAPAYCRNREMIERLTADL